MLLDWLVFGLLVFGATWLLNATVFKAKSASPSVAWGLAIAVFFLNLVALSIIKALRYKAISYSLPGFNPTISLKDILPGAFVFALLFFIFLRREQKKQTTASPQEGDMTKPEPQTLAQFNDREIEKEPNITHNSKPQPEEKAKPCILPISIDILNNQINVFEPKFLTLLLFFLVAGVVGGIGLIYLFSDSFEDAKQKLTMMNVPFNHRSFFKSIRVGDIVAIRLFLKAGMSPNSREGDEANLTALMVASWHGQQSVAEILLTKGADINAISGNMAKLFNKFLIKYMTALELAEEGGHVKLAKFLRSKGGRAVPDGYGWPPGAN